VNVGGAARRDALICNIWNEEEQEARYLEGTGTSFTVE
jgi:hypothetical protein